jgi:hypothetical protein
MKMPASIAALFSFAFLASSFASGPVELRLDSGDITAPSGDLILVRTANTPKKVTLRIPMELAKTSCVESETRRVFGEDPSCGEVPCQYQNEDFCTGGRDWDSCYHDETSCVRTGTGPTYVENVAFKLKFKDRVKLSAGETETYRFSTSNPTLVLGGPLKAKTRLVVKR